MLKEKLVHIVPVRISKSEFEFLNKESIERDRSISFVVRLAIKRFQKDYKEIKKDSNE